MAKFCVMCKDFKANVITCHVCGNPVCPDCRTCRNICKDCYCQTSDELKEYQKDKEKDMVCISNVMV